MNHKSMSKRGTGLFAIGGHGELELPGAALDEGRELAGFGTLTEAFTKDNSMSVRMVMVVGVAGDGFGGGEDEAAGFDAFGADQAVG